MMGNILQNVCTFYYFPSSFSIEFSHVLCQFHHRVKTAIEKLRGTILCNYWVNITALGVMSAEKYASKFYKYVAFSVLRSVNFYFPYRSL